MEKIYLDNGATSFPKPREVADAVYEYMTSIGANINRGGYQVAYDLEGTVFETREMLMEMFGGSDCKNVVFTKNVTESLNVVLKGLLKPGDHILCSSMEHNAVMRPLVQLAKKGVEFDRIPGTECGELVLDAVEGMIKDNTVAIVMTHASNLVGTLNPLKEVGEICQKHGLKFIVDSAQSAGIIPIDMKEMHIDALCFTGHKSLLGPQGIGGFILDEGMISLIDPLLSGGTGSISHTEEIPDFMPDSFEPGAVNIPGRVGLHASLKWKKKKGLDAIPSRRGRQAEDNRTQGDRRTYGSSIRADSQCRLRRCSIQTRLRVRHRDESRSSLCTERAQDSRHIPDRHDPLQFRQLQYRR